MKLKAIILLKSFLSAGPKNYGYKLNNGQTSCKIKGFSVNFIASDNFSDQHLQTLQYNYRILFH